MSLSFAAALSATAGPRAGRRLVFVGLWSLAVLVLGAGCGGNVSHGDRVPLTGSVTVKGQPLDVKATIYFDPLPGEGGIGSAGEVAGGKFEIPAESGPTPGKQYKVTVITAPGIPAEGTPREQIRQPERLEKKVELPARTDGAVGELVIDFP